jgi:AraC family transcriptional regulator, transcriptional activator of pobA
VAPGTVFFTQPGQVRRWEASNLDGACLFFARDFVSETFHDVRFLEQFPFFGAGSREAAIRLTRDERQAFLGAFSAISSEIRTLRGDTPDLIRARLYELLVLLNRWYRARHPAGASSEVHPTIARFRALVERQFTRRHRVGEYALELGVTPGHLNALCRWHLGQSAGALSASAPGGEAHAHLRRHPGVCRGPRAGLPRPGVLLPFLQARGGRRAAALPARP